MGPAIGFVTHLFQRKKTGENVKNYVSLVIESVFIFMCFHLHSKAGQFSNFSHAKEDFLVKSGSSTGSLLMRLDLVTIDENPKSKNVFRVHILKKGKQYSKLFK